MAKMLAFSSLCRAMEVNFQIKLVPVLDADNAFLGIEKFDNDPGNHIAGIGNSPYLDESPCHVHVPIADFRFYIERNGAFLPSELVRAYICIMITKNTFIIQD